MKKLVVRAYKARPPTATLALNASAKKSAQFVIIGT